jgi:enoyl-CoA hydratase/carnithine racemase/DNA-binding CsgD family transcriptional regulator
VTQLTYDFGMSERADGRGGSTEPEYFTAFENFDFSRTPSGVLTLRFHTDGGPATFTGQIHTDFPGALHEIGDDRDNRVLVLTGTGDRFMTDIDGPNLGDMTKSAAWDRTIAEGRRVMQRLVGLEVPVVAAVNGPASVHSEYVLLADIVIAADTTVFSDFPHLTFGIVRGDGIHLAREEATGLNRARYLTLTQGWFTAQQAERWGAVVEVLPLDQVLPRALELAESLAARPQLLTRYLAVTVRQRLSRRVAEGVQLGMALEGLTAADPAYQHDRGFPELHLEPLPPGDRLTAVLTSRIAALPEPTQAALLLAAVADGPDLRVAARHGAGPDPPTLVPAEQLGLITVDRTGVRFSHPLVRSAIYYSVPFARRAAAHRELAEALHDQPDRQAWHLAAAALNPDEHVASLLEATATQAQHRGGAAAAALAMERAAELSPEPEDQARRLVAAASAAVPTGQADWVQDLATNALAVTANPGLRLTARHHAGWALAWSGRRSDALSALISVAEEASRDQPDLAWDALALAATVACQSGLPASRQAVSRALGLLERQDPPPPGRTPGIDVHAHKLWIRASTDPAGSRSQLVPYLRKVAGLPLEEPSLWGTGSAAWILDESDLAVRLLQDAMQRLRAPGVRGTSGGSLTVLGWAYIDTGRWDEALDVAAEAAGLAEANQMDIVAASADVITATVLALRGDSAAARRHADRALAAVDPAECGLVAARARRALGVAALADGSYLQAFTQLRGLFSEDGTPLHNYASYLGVADLAAAAVRADRRMEGSGIIEHALSRLDGGASARLEQLIARARGILADPGGTQAHFGPALADPAGDQWPFERAQLRLDYGEWLRRRRRINDAKPVLTQALGTFRRLGARSWARRAQAELRASGVAGAPAEPDALGELTPQQRQIVRLASDGLTDREIGDRLFLSPRTVSSHLYRSYPKLGVASRHQLRDVIALTRTPTTAHESTGSQTLL